MNFEIKLMNAGFAPMTNVFFPQNFTPDSYIQFCFVEVDNLLHRINPAA